MHPSPPPPELDHLYDNVEVTLPEEADPWGGTTRGNFTALQFVPIQSTMKNYSEAVVAMDQQIGRILAALDALDLAENTIVVYSSDNGYFWGEHQLVDKRWAYEESIRIPFIVRYPSFISAPGRQAPQMVLNIDLAPSLLNLAGLPVPEEMEGESFKSILASATAPGRSAFRYEYFKDFFYKVPGITAVRTDTHIYITYSNKKGSELFDLVHDPQQRTNIIDTPEGKRLLPVFKKMLNELTAEEK